METLDYRYISTLVERTQAGSSDAFAELYAATYKKQYTFAYRYLRDEHLAQDALQEVYILVLKNITKIHNTKVFISWLNQINFRVCFDIAQRHKRNYIELGASEEEARSVPSPNGTPESNVSDKDEKQYIMKKIQELPMRESQAILMKYYNNMKLEDIASVLECNLSTVKRYLQRGRLHLEGVLKDL